MFLHNLVPDNGGLINSFASTEINQSNFIRTIIVRVLQNKEYTVLRQMAGDTFYIYESDEYPYIGKETSLLKRNDTTDSIKETITTSSNTKYLLIKIYNTYASEQTDYDELISSVQIGIKDEEYQPYQESRLTIPIPENEFAGEVNDDIKDKFELVYNDKDNKYHLYLEKNIGRIVLDGSEKWVYDSTYNYFRCPTYVFEKLPRVTMYEDTQISDKFIVEKSWMTFRDGGSNSIFKIANSGYKICVRNTNCSTVDEFKTWLLSNNVTVYYQIDEPYTLDLGAIDMPLSYYLATNVYTTHELEPNIEILYYCDFKTTILKKLSNLELRISDLEISSTS